MRYALILFCVLMAIHGQLVYAQKIVYVDVVAKGSGANEADAYVKALVNAVSQVNGESISAKVHLKSETIRIDRERHSSKFMSKEISRATDGVIKAWRPLSSERLTPGLVTGTVEASIAVLARSQQLKRMRIAVLARDGDTSKATQLLASNFTSLLTSSRKFAVLDRQHESIIRKQLQRIRTSGSREDSVRLRAEVAPDVIAVIGTSLTSSSAGRVYLEADINIIDYATRQIKFSDSKRFPMRSGDDVSNRRRINILAEKMSRTLLETVYPPVIVGASQGYITIAQGSDFFSVGDVLEVRKLVKELRDPHTKEHLGYDFQVLGEARITYTDKRMSKGKLAEPLRIEATELDGKRFQVFRRVSSTMPSSNDASARPLFTTSIDDEDDDD